MRHEDTGWTLADDAHGDPTIWHGDTAVARPGDLRVAPGYQRPLFDLLVAALVQPPEAVVALADALHRWNGPMDPYFIIQGRPHRVDEDTGDPYLPIARAALDALTPQEAADGR